MQLVKAGPWQTVIEYDGIARSAAAKGKRWWSEMEWDDLYQFARLGLYDAAVRYDPSYGAKFTTYAPKRVWGAVQDGAYEMMGYNSRIRMGDRNGCRTRHIYESLDELQELYGFDAGLEDYSFEYVDSWAAAESLLSLVWELLTAREKRILYERVVNGKTMAEIGVGLGVTESRICQIQAIIKRVARGVQRGKAVSIPPQRSAVSKTVIHLPEVSPEEDRRQLHEILEEATH